ncbi:MAG TPA: glycosyltransferase family 2 protein [Gemmataceae bacterium]|jgi:dolichol-phosphate mannosyltransferase|nr:glycosyltransferase family 2 protein [Gemmataceae bacterium]
MNSFDTPDLSIVSPCFNEEDGLREYHRRVSATVAPLCIAYEIVLVDDGSRDRTWDIMQELAAEDPQVVCIKLSRNHGQQLALTAGLSACRGYRVLILDADLQDPPELLPQMMELMDQGAEVVYGQRRHRAGESRRKLFTSALFYRFINRLTDVRIPQDTGDFRIMSRRVLDLFLSMPERQRFVRGMISWLGFRQVPLLYDRDARFAGETKWGLKMLVKLAIDAVTSFSTRPLKIASLLGVAFGLASFALLGYALISWLFLGAVEGWTSLMMVTTMLGGIQLLVIGIQGEYLGRLFDQAKGRPLFMVDQVVGGGRLKAVEAPVLPARSAVPTLMTRQKAVPSAL